MTRESIKINVKKHAYKSGQVVYTGYIVAYNGSKRIWSKSSGINRITPEVAKLDAERMQKEALSGFQI
jgi:hypothetical protein